MKRVMIIFALAAFTTAFAQDNKSEKTETITTKVSVKDNKGVHTDVKEVKRTESQPIKLDPKDAGKMDQDYNLGPTRVKTNVTYSSNDHSYMFENDKNGYKVYDTKSGKKMDSAILRPTSKRGFYIMSEEGQNSFGYFNENGDFVVESYDPKTDAIVSQIYKIQLKEVKQ